MAAVTIFAGQRPADEIPAFLDAADVLVSPRSFGTNTPLKIYQYLRSGRPIVATVRSDTGIAREIAGAGEVVPPGDPTGLAAAIEELSANPALARAYGANARRLAERRWHRDTILADLEQQFIRMGAAGARRTDRRFT